MGAQGRLTETDRDERERGTNKTTKRRASQKRDQPDQIKTNIPRSARRTQIQSGTIPTADAGSATASTPEQSITTANSPLRVIPSKVPGLHLEAQDWGSSLARHTGCPEDTPPSCAPTILPQSNHLPEQTSLRGNHLRAHPTSLELSALQVLCTTARLCPPQPTA